MTQTTLTPLLQHTQLHLLEYWIGSYSVIQLPVGDSPVECIDPVLISMAVFSLWGHGGSYYDSVPTVIGLYSVRCYYLGFRCNTHQSQWRSQRVNNWSTALYPKILTLYKPIHGGKKIIVMRLVSDRELDFEKGIR